MFFVTARSRLKFPKPRRAPAPPPLLSTPRSNRRNPEYTALGLENRLIPEPALVALPAMPVETTLSRNDYGTNVAAVKRRHHFHSGRASGIDRHAGLV